jgi:hypothetical protein
VVNPTFLILVAAEPRCASVVKQRFLLWLRRCRTTNTSFQSDGVLNLT